MRLLDLSEDLAVNISNEQPASAEEIYAALVALRAEPVMDRESRTDGPHPDDRFRLLGALLATVELEITAATRVDDEFFQGFAAVIGGWSQKVKADAAVGAVVMINRLQRTAVQMMGPSDEEEERPGQAASMAAVMVATDLLAAQIAADAANPDGARRSLNRVEGSLADMLVGMHVLRVCLGDVDD
ncbi:hypothetical protein [Streptomyces sp. NPDC001843]|uniref:hypothetical protein n=1 Tax=Streptomyces sp. NPDC001843 TaxID=3364617 RepID=UPI0036BA047A